MMMNEIPGTIKQLPNYEFEWSGKGPVPSLSQRVNILLNGWEGCSGTVVGYRVDDCGESGKWLGVCVLVADRPAWHVREMPNRNVSFFVGCEVENVNVA